MLIPDIFRSYLALLLALSLSLAAQAQREEVKFGLPQLDTALTVWPLDQINSQGFEFSPTYFRNGILFIYGPEAHPLDYEEGKVFYRPFYAPMDDEGALQAAIPLSFSDIGRGHFGPSEFVDSIQTLFISKTVTENPALKFTKTGAGIQIYSRLWKDSLWQQEKVLAVNDSLANSFHPTLSQDGELLIFSSDRSEETKSFNLFASEWVDGQWSKPYPLKKINSSANDAFPRLYNNKYLFFSSDRNGGRGDYDFYLSIQRPSGWSEPINLGGPFNSKDDDMGISIASDGKHGYFSSNRGGSDDLYGFSSSIHLFLEELPPRTVEIIAINPNSGMRLENVQIWTFDRNQRGQIMDPARYQSVIIEQAKVPGLTLQTKKKSAASLRDPQAETNRDGKTFIEITPDQPLQTLVAYKKGFEDVEIELDYFSTDSTVQLLFEELTCVPLEIKAVGPKGNRVREFDVFINNRSENKVRSFSFPLTERICIEHDKTYEIIAKRTGAISDTFHIEPQKEDIKKVAVLFRLLPEMKAEARDFSSTAIDDLKEGVTVELNNIYYDFDKASIRDGAEEELIRLADIMNSFPLMEIELAAHTDSRGKVSYNLELSQRRAEAAKAILMREGVKSERVTARGYGSSQLKNHCREGVQCSESEHQENRRTEIRILKAPMEIQIEYGADEAE